MVRQLRYPGEGFHRHDAHDENESDQISGPVIDIGAHSNHEDSHAGINSNQFDLITLN